MSGAFRIRLSRPLVDEETIEEVVRVLRTPDLSLGPRLEAFEAAFARTLGVDHAVAVSSGTAGLHLAVRILGLGPGDEAITSPFSFIASSNCLLFERARPVFVDIDPDRFTLDLEAARGAITGRTRAIIPVHVFGNPVDMDQVQEIAALRRLAVIEDACEAVGGLLRGRALGGFGDFGVFGFYPNKQITTGEGGVVVTDRAEWAARLRSLRNQGRSPSGDGSFSELGWNYRLPELSAALGEGQIRRLPEILRARREREARYRDLLAGIEELRVPPIPEGRSPFVFIIQTHEPAFRERLRQDLARAGIQSAIYFRPIHLEPFYRESFGFREGQFPQTEHAGKTCLAIPFHTAISEMEQEEVAREIRKSARAWSQSALITLQESAIRNPQSAIS